MLFAVNWVYTVLGKTGHYGMDDQNICRNQLTKYLKDDEHAIVLAKTGVKAPEAKTVKNCDIKLSPASGNKNKHLQMSFETFYINDCDVSLDIEESASKTFQDSTKLASLTCNSDNPDVLYSQQDHQVLFRLQRSSLQNTDYNFRINVTTVPERPASGIGNLPIIIGVSAGIVIIVTLLIACIIKLMCDRRKKNGKRSDINEQTQLSSTRETTAVPVSSGDTHDKHPYIACSQPLLNYTPDPSLNPDPGSINAPQPDPLPTQPVAARPGGGLQSPPSYDEAIGTPQPSAPPFE